MTPTQLEKIRLKNESEYAKQQNLQEIKRMKFDARKEALRYVPDSRAYGGALNNITTNRTAKSIVVEAEVIYQWLVKDLG
jgi:hypothetical protein